METRGSGRRRGHFARRREVFRVNRWSSWWPRVVAAALLTVAVTIGYADAQKKASRAQVLLAQAKPAAASPSAIGAGTGTGSGASSAPPAGPVPLLEVATGLFFNDFSHVDLKRHQFFADFYVWFRAKLPKVGEKWSPASIEFMNGIKVELTKVEEKDLPDGNHYWEYRAKGTFRAHFDLSHYPLDAQRLPIVIEDSTWFSKKLVLVPDGTQSTEFKKWIDPLVKVPDWLVSTALIRRSIHDYGTNFGDTTPGQSADLARYSRLTFETTLERASLPHLVKFLIPLLVISGMAFVTFFISATEFSTASRLCGTALLSSIALHITSSRNLPEVGYLLISDKIFIMFYLAIFITLVEKVAVNHLITSARESRALRIERVFRYGFPAFLGSGSLFIFLTR